MQQYQEYGYFSEFGFIIEKLLRRKFIYNKAVGEF